MPGMFLRSIAIYKCSQRRVESFVLTTSRSPFVHLEGEELLEWNRSLLSDQLRKQGELVIAHEERRELEEILARSTGNDEDDLLTTELNRKSTRYWVLELELNVLKQACALQLCSLSKKLGWNLQLQSQDGEPHGEGVTSSAERPDTKNLKMQLEMNEEKIEQALKDCSVLSTDIAQHEQENIAITENCESSVLKIELRDKIILDQQVQKTEQEVKCLSNIEIATNMDCFSNLMMDVERRSASVKAEAERKVSTFRKAMKILGKKLVQQSNELARAKRLISIFKATSKCFSKGRKKDVLAGRTAVVNSKSVSPTQPIARTKSPSQRRHSDSTPDNNQRRPPALSKTTAIQYQVQLNPNSDVFYPQQCSQKWHPRPSSYVMAEMPNYGMACPEPSRVRPRNRYKHLGQRRHHDKLQQQQQQHHHQQQQQQQGFIKMRLT